MPIRITDSSNSARHALQAADARRKLDEAQERVSSGRRINRPSDDPAGAAAVLRLRTSQAEVAGFARSAAEVNSALLTGDTALDSYEQLIDRARTLLGQAVSDVANTTTKEATATQIEGMRDALLQLANQQSGNRYVFGGTKQSAPPFAADGTFQGTGALPQFVQIEPGRAPVASGVVAADIFTDEAGNIVAALADAATAVRGTSDPAADRAGVRAAIDRLRGFAERASVARVGVGVGIGAAEAAADRLGRDKLSLEERAQRVESADLAESAIALAESSRAVEATLQSIGQVSNRRTLLDIIG